MFTHGSARSYVTGNDDDAPALPRGIDPPEDDAHPSAAEAARNLRDRVAYYYAHRSTLTAVQRESVRQHVSVTALRFQEATTGLARDGVYGRATRAALALALGVPVASLGAPIPAPRTFPAEVARARAALAPRRPTPTRPTTPTDPAAMPATLPVAAALAQWTEHASAADSTAARQLRGLHQNAAWLLPRTEGHLSGIEIGAVPDAPTAASSESWAEQAWRLAQEEGEAARRELVRRADELVAQGERALTDTRRALDAEADRAIREALTMTEAGLTAILRPLSRGIATAAAPLGAGLILVGGAALLFMLPKGRR